METVQKTIEITQLQHTDEVVDVPVVLVTQVPQVRVVMKTVETPQLEFVEQVPQVRVVKKTVEDSQLQIVEKTIENPETQISDEVTDACLTCDVKCKVACETCVKDILFMVAGEMTVAGKRDHETVVRKSDHDCGRFFHVDGTSGSMHQQHTPGQAEEEREKKTGEGGQREEGEKGRERKKGKERAVEEQECKQIKKDATGWTMVTRNKRERKMVQIFVKVDGGKTSTMEVKMSDRVDDIVKRTSISDQDVYVTSGGRTLRRSDKLESCEVRDGSTVEITSRMRGGGRHKDKKSKSEKKQTTNSQRPEKRDGESRSGEGPELIPMDEAMRRLEESDEFQKNMECVSEGSEGEVQQKVQNYLACMQKVSWMNKEQFEHLESGVWQAVEARRKGRDEQQEQRRRGEQEQWRQTEQGQNTEQEQSKQGKQVRFGEEQQLGKTGAENAGEPEVMDRTTEVRTGRGSTGLVRGGDERCRADETSKGKGKGNGGKGEHESKGGGFGKEERDRVAPNMGAGGSHPQATSDPGEREIEEKKESRGMRWADCEGKGERRPRERERDKTRDRRGGKQERARGGEKARARARGTAGSGRGGKRAQDARRRTEPGGERAGESTRGA